MKKFERNLIKLKTSGKAPRIFLKTSKLKNRNVLIKSSKLDPIKSNIYKSYLLLIEDLIKSDDNLMSYYEIFLNDLRSVFKRDHCNDGLNISAIQKYLTPNSFGKYFVIDNNNVVNVKKIKTKFQINSAIKDLELDPVFLLFFYVLLGLSSKSYFKIFKKINVCKIESCNLLYANNRKNVCSDKCQKLYGNKEKSKKRYFKTYQAVRTIKVNPIKKQKKRSKLL